MLLTTGSDPRFFALVGAPKSPCSRGRSAGINRLVDCLKSGLGCTTGGGQFIALGSQVRSRRTFLIGGVTVAVPLGNFDRLPTTFVRQQEPDTTTAGYREQALL